MKNRKLNTMSSGWKLTLWRMRRLQMCCTANWSLRSKVMMMQFSLATRSLYSSHLNAWGWRNVHCRE
ncbi:hypothetical protein MAR_000482 [Mya arenaria]|uniref:Uncharacterized protein n=1 Tax=Mya arenaria TaxID=6604 RepID=A0ABY7FBB0_MYAAR|nr:hypothetical protein MAR_000482 [Mya arenaria]